MRCKVWELRDKAMRINILKQRESTNRKLVTVRCDLDRMVVKKVDKVEDKEVEVVV